MSEQSAVAELERIATEHFDGFDVVRSYPGGFLWARAEPVEIRIEGFIGTSVLAMGEDAAPRAVRAAALARAEDFLEALPAAGWFLTHRPSLEFGGSIEHAVATLGRELVKPPVEYAISLRVSVNLAYLTVPASAASPG